MGLILALLCPNRARWPKTALVEVLKLALSAHRSGLKLVGSVLE